MKRVVLILLVLLLLSGIGIIAWTAAGLPRVGMVWRYGFSCGPRPTGRTLTVEGVEFVEIGPGCFLMGSEKIAEGGDLPGRWCARFGLPWGDQPKPSNEMPVHWVELARGFWIARTEITNAQHEHYQQYAHLDSRSTYSPGNGDPATSVSWQDAKRYCNWLTDQSGLNIRLPSESEWECACRGGSPGEFCFGDDEQLLTSYAWFNANAGGRSREVGTRRANAWGLHDLHGNAGEWCEDTWHPTYENAPADGSAWRSGGEKELKTGTPIRMIRGGSWVFSAGRCRSSFRAPALNRGSSLGFRPAFVLTR